MTNKYSFILLLMGVLLAVSASAEEKQKSKDRGHWSLTTKKTFIEGQRSNGDNTGIISGRDGEAVFRMLHYIPSYFQPDGTFSTEDKGGTTVIHQGGRHTPEQRNIHRLAVTWSRPPQYVKIGEENKIALDVRATLDGSAYSLNLLRKDLPSAAQESFSINVEVGVMPEVVLGKDTIGFTLFRNFLEQSDNIGDIDKYLVRYIDNLGIDAEEAGEALNRAYEDGSAVWRSTLKDKDSGRLYNDEAWSQNLSLGKEAYLMVIVKTTLQSRMYMALKTSSYTISQYYLYKNYANGGDVDITIRADDENEWGKSDKDSIEGGGDDDEKGESEGTLLPPWVIPVAVATTGAVVAYKILRKRREDEPESEPDSEPQNEAESKVFDKPKGEAGKEVVMPAKSTDEEEDKEPSTFKMILYKDFGSTLMVGDKPKLVGARIEEITAKGKKIHRPDLTAQIEICQGNNITIADTGMAGKYKAASIIVEKLPEEEPWEGDIWFIFRAPGGALRNKVVFNIENGRIEFFQPNLTLPTDYKEVAKLPFRIHGATDKAKVTVRIDSKEYKAKVCKGEKPEEIAHNIWYAHITENHSAVPPKKDRKAGEYTISHLEVEVREPNGHTIEGSEPLLRYNMGLIFECSPLIGCYAEPYNPQEHPFKVPYNGQDVCPAINEATYCVMTWDEKEHQLRRVVPVNDESKFEVVPLPAEDDAKDDAADYESKKTRGMSDEEIINGVGLQFYIKEILDDGSSVCCIYARGMLDAPARRKVRIHIETVYENEKYEAERDVWLTSQPIRHFRNTSEELEALNLDNRMTDNLTHICQFIISHDLLDRIGPVYRLAQMQLDAYDPRFGYDPAMTSLIRDTFLRYVSGETLGANAQAEGVEYMGLAAELLVAFAKTNKQVESWLDAHGGIWTRIAIGMATLGWSEPFMLYLRVADRMVERANNPKPPGEWAKYFSVGVWEFAQVYYEGLKPVVEYAYWENVVKLTGQLGGEFVATYRPDLAANVANFAQQVTGRVKDKLGIFGKDVKEIAAGMKNFVTDRIGKQMQSRLATTKALNSKAARSADEVIKKWRQSSRWTPEEELADKLFRDANVKAMKDIKQMERTCMDYIRYRTPESKAAFRKWCYKMQANKTAQKQLSMYKSNWSNNVRSEYYRMLQEDYRIIDKEALSDACQKLRKRGIMVNEDDLYVFCATNSDSTSLYWGDTMTRDRDLSMMYKPKPTKANPRPIPQEVPQDIAEESYGKAYQKRTGMTMKEGDQAVVQKGSKEMIGAGEKDLNSAFKKEHFNEKFIDLDGVATAFEHKPAEWINEGARLRALGDEAGALSKEEEGLRQALKLFFNSLEKRSTYRGTFSMVKPKEVELFHVMKRLEVKTQNTYSLSMPDFKKILKSEYKMEITDIPKLMKELVYRVES